MAKVRKIDFSPDEFLIGVTGMKPMDIAVYWVACSLMYSSGDAIQADDERLFSIIKARKSDIIATLNRLVARGKLQRNGSELAQKRCRTELERAAERIQNATDAASKRWRNEGDIASKQGVTDATAENGALLSLTTTTTTTNSISPDSPGDSAAVVNFPGGETPKAGRRRKNQHLEPEGFAPVYDAFPLKADPDDAARAFRKVVEAGKATPEELLFAAKAYARERAGQDPKFTKHMATWLNKGSYRNQSQPSQARSGGCPL